MEFTQCMSEEVRPKCVTGQGKKEGREGGTGVGRTGFVPLAGPGQTRWMRRLLESPALKFSEFGGSVSSGCHQHCRFKLRWGFSKEREEGGDNLQCPRTRKNWISVSKSRSREVFEKVDDVAKVVLEPLAGPGVSTVERPVWSLLGPHYLFF